MHSSIDSLCFHGIRMTSGIRHAEATDILGSYSIFVACHMLKYIANFPCFLNLKMLSNDIYWHTCYEIFRISYRTKLDALYLGKDFEKSFLSFLSVPIGNILRCSLRQLWILCWRKQLFQEQL